MISDPMDPEAPQSQSQSPLLRDEHRKGSATPYIKPPQSGFDPYQCPPDFDLAISHGKAKRVYELTAQSAKQRLAVLDKEVCPCCGLPKHGKLLPLRAKLSELYHLGSGYPLYFKLTKRCAVLLALIFVTSGLFDLISNAAAGDCVSPDDAPSDSLCVRNIITIGTIANKKDHPGLLTAQMALTLVSMIVILVYTQVIRYQLRKTHIAADDATVTPADYTIKVTGLDPELSDDDIRDWIEGVQTPERKVKPRKINRTYNITEYTRLKKKKDMLEMLKRQVLSEDKKQKILIEAEITETRLQQLTDAGLKPTHTVLITFEKAEQAAYIIEEFSKGRERSWYEYLKAFIGTSAYTFNGKVVYIERAPEPTDILWQNLGHSSWEKFKKRSYTRIVAAFIIAISFAVIVVINWGQGKATTSDKFNFFTITLLSGLGSIMIVVINVLLGLVTKHLAHHEKHGSYTSYFTGVAEKLSVSQLINTAFTTMLAEIVLYNHFKQDSSLEGGLESASFYGEGGLLQDMFYVFISNAFLTPVLNYFDIGYFLKLHNRKKALKQGSNSTMTQQEAQTLFEEPEMDLAVNHSWLISTVLLSGFYAPAVPAALIFGCAGIILGYWVDKYLLLRRNIYPIALQNELSNQMLLSLEWMGAVMGIGNLFFVVTLKNSDGDFIYNVVPKGLVWLILALGLLLAFLPTKALNERFFPLIDEVTENHTYDAIKAEFATDYKIQNPVTSKEGLHEQAETLKRKKILIPKIRKNLRLGAHLLFSEKHFSDALKNKKVKQQSGEEGEEDSVIHSDMSQKSSSGDNKPLIPNTME